MFMKTELTTYKIAVISDDGQIIIPQQSEVQTFLTTIIRMLENRKVLKILLNETSYVVILVRERIEKEKVLESLGVMPTITDEESEDII